MCDRPRRAVHQALFPITAGLPEFCMPFNRIPSSTGIALGPLRLLRLPLLIWLVAPLLLLALTLPASAQEKLELKLWQVPTRDARTVEEKANLAVMKRFLELHPDIDLQGFRGVTAPGLDMDAQPLMAMAGGVAPDVMYVNFRQSDSYISQGFLAPLDEYVKRWAGVNDIRDAPAKLRHLILPQMWPVIMRPGPDGKEHIWAIPYGGALAKVLVYRKDHFRKAGLDPERPPKNWDELYTYAKRLTDSKIGQYGFGLAAGQSASWHFIDFIWSAGGDALRQEADGEWRACYNGPEALAALKLYQKLCRSRVAYRSSDTDQKWRIGKIGMTFAYINDQMMSTVNPNLIGIAALPAGPGQDRDDVRLHQRPDDVDREPKSDWHRGTPRRPGQPPRQ
jgi:ABC-type glycerol-3-phosphate transport system substrate-binding protein